MPVAELKARTPCGDMLPLTHGAATVTELDLGHVTSVMGFGDDAAVSNALEAAHGVAFPKPNRSTGKDGDRCIWFGLNQALLIGPAPEERLKETAALVDQSDGWCAVSLSGAASEDVLARMVPVDLRAGHFKRGHTVRTQLGHMMASITRTGVNSFMILVFRSMASTLVDELGTAMQAVASRRT